MKTKKVEGTLTAVFVRSQGFGVVVMRKSATRLTRGKMQREREAGEIVISHCMHYHASSVMHYHASSVNPSLA